MDPCYWKDEIRFEELMATDMKLDYMFNGEIVYHGKFREGLFERWWDIEITGRINYICIYYPNDKLSELVNNITNFSLCLYPAGIINSWYKYCDYNYIQIKQNIKPNLILTPDDIDIAHVKY